MTVTTEHHRLTGWGTFDDLGRSIKALLFGHLVQRSVGVIEQYHSDLFHDVNWLDEHVTGPTTFDWLVRTSGTNIAESARIAVQIGAPGGVFYRITLAVKCRDAKAEAEGNGDWSATFMKVPLDEVADLDVINYYPEDVTA